MGSIVKVGARVQVVGGQCNIIFRVPLPPGTLDYTCTVRADGTILVRGFCPPFSFAAGVGCTDPTNDAAPYVGSTGASFWPAYVAQCVFPAGATDANLLYGCIPGVVPAAAARSGPKDLAAGFVTQAAGAKKP